MSISPLFHLSCMSGGKRRKRFLMPLSFKTAASVDLQTWQLVIDGWMDGCMDDMRFFVLFNSISVISGLWADDNERLCAMEPLLRMR